MIQDVVVSCFPQRRECGVDGPDRYDTTDVLENILLSLAKFPIDMSEDGGPPEPVLRIVRECFSTVFDPTENLDDDVRFIDIFNNSINRVVSPPNLSSSASALTRDTPQNDKEVICYESFVNALKTPGLHHDLLPINTEFYLLREIKDILEELRMMR